MEKWLSVLGRVPPWGAFFLALGLSFLMALLDWVTGREVSVSFFYSLPTLWAAWTLGRSAVLAFSLFNAGLGWAVTLLTGQTYSQIWIPVWNSGMRFLFFLILGLLVVQVRSYLHDAQKLARTDPLTQILNRLAFQEAVEREIDRRERSGSPLVLMTFDLDDFKEVNDTRGHGTGDRVLEEVGRVLKVNLRPYDLPARLGGDEFAVLFPLTGLGQAYDLVVRVKTALEDAMQAKKWPVGFSFGAVEARTGDQFTTLLDRSDRLMYRVKHDGKNGILVQSS